MDHSKLRRQIAFEAARLMYSREEGEYYRAKMKAARHCYRGWVKPADLPSNAEIRDQLASSGGLAGLSGIAGGDLRDIEAALRKGNRDAATAIEVFVYQIRKTVGAYAAALGGLDAIAFTGGIGENAAWLRTSVSSGNPCVGK